MAHAPPPEGPQDSAARRLFVGWMAGPAEREALGALVEAIRPRVPKSGLRWVAPADLHLTLRFLGATRPEVAAAVAALLPGIAAAHPAIAASAHPLRWWPAASAPRVLVLRVDSRGALERIAASLDESLSGLGIAADPRRFRAHLTLARAAHLGRQAAFGDAAWPALSLHVDSLALVESAPRGDGTRYRALLHAPLRPR